MLAEERRGAADRPRRPGHADGNARRPYAARDRVIDLGDQSEMPDHRIVEDFREIVDRTDRNIGLAQLAHDVGLPHCLHARGDDRDERVAVFDAARVVCESAIVEKWAAYLKPVAERRAHLEPWYQASAESRGEVVAEYQQRFMATITRRRQTNAKWREASQAAKAAGKEAPAAPKFPAGEDRFFTEVTASKAAASRS